MAFLQYVLQADQILLEFQLSVLAKLKVIIKWTLRQFGYPPDMQKLATETVLKQAELIANEITNE